MSKVKKIRSVLLIAILILALGACGAPDAKKLVQINDVKITSGELNLYFPLYGLTTGKDITTIKDKTKLAELKKTALEDLVSMEVIRQYYDGKKQNVIPGTKDADFKAFMDQVNSDAATKKFLADNKITESYLQKFFLNQYYTSAFFSEVTAEFKNPEVAGKDYYNTHKSDYTNEQVRASHILVKTKPEAEAILKELQGGADFATIAKAKSIDTGSGAKGGDLGYFTKDQMVAAFSEAAFSTPIGKLSGIVETKFGFHIIKVVDKKIITKTYEEAKQDILYKLFDQVYKAKLEKIKATMKIDYAK